MPRCCSPLLLCAAFGLLGGMAIADEGVRFVRIPEGGIQPQIVRDSAGTVHLLYFKEEPAAGNVFYVRRAEGDDGFSKPLRVNSQAGSAIAVGSIRGAQLAVGRNGRAHVAWNGSGTAEPKGPVKYGNPMLYSRLNDEGTAFEAQRNVIDKAYVLDGGGSVAADDAGHVYVAWHAGNAEASRRVWLVRSSDEGASFTTESAIDREELGACGCCGLKAFADREGSVFVLYRSAREATNRDMHLLVSTDSGNLFANQEIDRWKIATCPMSSESFIETPESVYAAWETNGQVFMSRIDKKTRLAGTPIAAPGTPGGRKHPTLATDQKGKLLLAWTEGTGWQKGGALAWQEFDARGKPTKVRGRRDGIPVWSFPAAYVDADGTFAIVY